MIDKNKFESFPDLDVSVLNNFKILEEHDANILQDLITIFEANVPNQVEDLIKSINDSNKDRIIYLSHTLKSSTATLGLMKLHKLFAHWELESKNEATFLDYFSNEKKQELISFLKDIFSKARTELLKFRK